MTAMNSGQTPGQMSPLCEGRIKLLDYAGRRVVFHDLSHCDPGTMQAVLNESRRIITLEPENSVLSLVDVAGCTFDQQSITLLKSVALANAPFVKRAAIVGLSDLQRLVYEAVLVFSRRKIPLFLSRKEALDWLIQD